MKREKKRPGMNDPKIDRPTDAKGGYQYWRGTYYLNGVRYRIACDKDFRDKSENEARENIVGKIRAIHEKQTSASRKSLDNLIPQWYKLIERDPKLSFATIRCYKSVANCWLLEGNGDSKHYPIHNLDLEKDFSRSVCRNWIWSIECAGQSVHKIKSVLCRFFNDARDEGWINENVICPLELNSFSHKIIPAGISVLQKRTGDTESTLALEIGAIEKLLNADDATIKPVDRLRYLFSITVGPRNGEALGLRFSDFTIVEGISCVSILRQLIRLKSEIRANRGNIDADCKLPKRNKVRRNIPMHAELISAIQWWKDVGWKAYVGRDWTENDYVFPSVDGSKRKSETGETLRKHLRALGLADNQAGVYYGMHSFRRTLESQLREAKVDGDIINLFFAHSIAGVGAKHYWNKDRWKFSAEVNRLRINCRRFS